jgi:hypothetical protein
VCTTRVIRTDLPSLMTACLGILPTRCRSRFQLFGADASRSFAAIFTKSARESAFIFCITLPRYAFAVDLADSEFATNLLIEQLKPPRPWAAARGNQKNLEKLSPHMPVHGIWEAKFTPPSGRCGSKPTETKMCLKSKSS